jgi:signal peptidase
VAEAVAVELSFNRGEAARELIVEALRAGNPAVIRVGGSSMIPTIWPGDTIEIAPADNASIGTGRVVLYSRDGRLYAHRIVEIDDAGRARQRIVTRGDALAVDDPAIDCPEILGVVSAVIRQGRRIQLAERAPSHRARLLAFAIRNSSIARRLILGVRARCRGKTLDRCPA